MSASELASFVAAVIDDGIAPELQRKNNELKRKIDALESTIHQHESERLLVQITGRYGRPIYGEKSLKHGIPQVDEHAAETLWWLAINNDKDDAYDAFICPLDEEPSTQLELRVGGILILPRLLEQLSTIVFNYEEHADEDDLDKLVYLENVDFQPFESFEEEDCPINQLLGRVGPITIRHYKALCKMAESGTDLCTRDLFEHDRGAQPARNMTLAIQEIEFYKKNISGCISLLKQLGFRTRCDQPSSSSSGNRSVAHENDDLDGTRN